MEKYQKPNVDNFIDKITNKDLKPKKKLKESQMFESFDESTSKSKKVKKKYKK